MVCDESCFVFIFLFFGMNFEDNIGIFFFWYDLTCGKCFQFIIISTNFILLCGY